MDDIRLEGACGALHNGFVALNQIQNVHAAARVMRNRAGKPVAARFDKFQLMESGALLALAGTFPNGFETVDQLTPHPFRGAVPLNVSGPVLDIDGPRPAV